MESKNASLLYASSIGELSFIRKLIDDGVYLNTQDKDGNSAIHEAVKANQVEALKLLLEKGADINAINNDGNSALHVAILATSFECFEFLLISGIKVNRFNKEKKSELLCAIHLKVDEALKEKRHKIIELLIENENIDLKAETSDSVAMFDGSNYLFEAIRCDNYFAVVTLIEKDITLCETKDENGNYPIHYAVTYGLLDITRLLISKNKKYADIPGEYNLAPLHFAVPRAYFGIIEYLIEQNADVNVLSNGAFTPLHVAISMFKKCCMNDETVCKNTLDLKMPTNFQEKVVTMRKKCAFLAIAAYLIENGGANIHLRDEDEETALDYIETENDIVETLKMMFLHKPLNDKIKSLTRDLHALRLENIKLREEMHQIKGDKQ